MIRPEAIPQIPGDLDALAGHATELATVGAEFAATGADIHAAWRGLAPLYDAPEAGVLLDGTAPVQQTSARVGDDLAAVGRVLHAYVAVVRPLKERLETLRAEAGALVAELDANPDWREDGDAVDRHNSLLNDVNAAVAEWTAAQRDCANAINALYCGTHYVADDGDGHHDPREFGFTAGQLDAAADGVPWGRPEKKDGGFFGDIALFGHSLLDVAGLVPGFGEIADGLNAVWYAAEGDLVNSGLSAAGMIPFAGWAATGGKLSGKAAAAGKAADHVAPTPRPRTGSRGRTDPLPPASALLRDATEWTGTGRKGGKLPLRAEPDQVLYRRDTATGGYRGYAVYDRDGLIIKRVDLEGKGHAGVDTPHVLEYRVNRNQEGKTFLDPIDKKPRTANPDEIP